MVIGPPWVHNFLIINNEYGFEIASAIVNNINILFFDCLILFEKTIKTNIGIKEYRILKPIGVISFPNIKNVNIPTNLVGSIE